MKKYFSLLIISILFLGVGCSSRQDRKLFEQQKEIENQKKLIEQQNTTLNSLKKTVEDIKMENSQKVQVIDLPIKNTKSVSENLDNVLINYKLDVNSSKDKMLLLLNAVNNSPEKICPQIVSNQTSRNSVYYMVIDDLSELESKYGKYKDSIEYIGNNLPGQWFGIELVKDKCKVAGFIIN